MAERLYLANLSLLIGHEIDSAYWHEWSMLFLPGGIQLFVVLNVLIIMFFIYGYAAVCRKDNKGMRYSLFLSIIGMGAFIIHGIFLYLGYPQFTLPVSVIILAACFLVSSWQLRVTIKIIKRT